MALAAVGHQKLVGPITAGHIFWTSRALGRYVQRGESKLRWLANHKRGELGREAYHPVSRTENPLKVVD
jgi:hypothetical protein